MHVMERATAPWVPLQGTVEAVAAGQFWDAVAVPQYIGLAALEYLDQAWATVRARSFGTAPADPGCTSSSQLARHWHGRTSAC